MILVHLWWAFQYHTGMTDGGGRPYLFWSGFGSDFAELAILGGIVHLYRQHNCQVKGCFRIGHHAVEGTPYKTCHIHTTEENHATIHKGHAKRYPKQHKLMNNGRRKPVSK